MTPLSLNAYAKHRAALGLSGGTATAVCQAVKAKRITVTAEKKIADPAIADAEWERNTAPRPGARQSRPEALPGPSSLPGRVITLPASSRREGLDASPAALVAPMVDAVEQATSAIDSCPGTDAGSAGDYHSSRAKREYYQAEMAKLELGRMEGSLLDRADVSKALGDALVEIRSRAMALPAALASRIALETDPVAVEAMLKEAIKRLLTELSQLELGPAK